MSNDPRVWMLLAFWVGIPIVLGLLGVGQWLKRRRMRMAATIAKRLCPECLLDPDPMGKNDSPRKCAFENGGVFISDNWNCYTMNRLRVAAYEDALGTEDQYAALLTHDGWFIVLGWYKHRGRTEAAWLMDGEEMRPLSLEDALAWIAYDQQSDNPEADEDPA